MPFHCLNVWCLVKKPSSYQKWDRLSLIWRYFNVCPCISIRSQVCPSVGWSVGLWFRCAKPRITADPDVVLYLCNLLTFIHFHLLSFTFIPFHSFSFTYNFHPFARIHRKWPGTHIGLLFSVKKSNIDSSNEGEISVWHF